MNSDSVVVNENCALAVVVKMQHNNNCDCAYQLTAFVEVHLLLALMCVCVIKVE